MKNTADNTSTLRSFGIADVVIIIALLGGIFTILPMVKATIPDSVAVFKQNTMIAQYPLDTDLIFSVKGNRGPVEIEIRDRKVRIIHVNCPHQICKRSGSISRPFEQLVCAPNHVLLEIRSTDSKKAVDGVTY
ncbi:MAG: NusG domain II-containing protein [Chitinispirillaceae bacterium]